MPVETAEDLGPNIITGGNSFQYAVLIGVASSVDSADGQLMNLRPEYIRVDEELEAQRPAGSRADDHLACDRSLPKKSNEVVRRSAPITVPRSQLVRLHGGIRVRPTPVVERDNPRDDPGLRNTLLSSDVRGGRSITGAIVAMHLGGDDREK